MILRLVETHLADETVTLHYRDETGVRRTLSLTPDFWVDGVSICISGAEPVVDKEADLHTYVTENALTADNASGTFVVLQSQQKYNSDNELRGVVVGKAESQPWAWHLGENDFTRPGRRSVRI